MIFTGLDALIDKQFAPLRGRRIGLVTNQSAVSREGVPAIEVLQKASGVHLVALFGPEHGVRGDVPAGRWIPSYRDRATGLPVWSLYGPTKVPTAAMLKGIETLVFDLQDIGSRSYTYLSTLGCVLEGAARQGVSVVVLDRPNPCGLERVEGGPVRAGFTSFVSKYPLAYRHGMTLGEAARMIVGAGFLATKNEGRLSVVPCPGLTRGFFDWESSGLLWRRSSPNVPKAETALYYAATGIVGELTCLSIGVGTPTPFELAGAPGLDAAAFTRRLAAATGPGIAFDMARWMPANGVFAGRECYGARIRITDPVAARLTPLNFAILSALHAGGIADPFRDREARRMFDLSCGTDRVRRAFLAGATVAEMTAVFDTGVREFERSRQPYLLYA